MKLMNQIIEAQTLLKQHNKNKQCIYMSFATFRDLQDEAKQWTVFPMKPGKLGFSLVGAFFGMEIYLDGAVPYGQIEFRDPPPPPYKFSLDQMFFGL